MIAKVQESPYLDLADLEVGMLCDECKGWCERAWQWILHFLH